MLQLFLFVPSLTGGYGFSSKIKSISGFFFLRLLDFTVSLDYYRELSVRSVRGRRWQSIGIDPFTVRRRRRRCTCRRRITPNASCRVMMSSGRWFTQSPPSVLNFLIYRALLAPVWFRLILIRFLDFYWRLWCVTRLELVWSLFSLLPLIL